MTGRSLCDFVVWTQKELHIERLTLNEALLKSALPTAKTLFKICIVPELLGKWHTRQHSTTEKNYSLQCEEDDGHGATVKKGRVMTWLHVIAGHVLQSGFTLNMLDYVLCPLVNGTVQHVRQTLPRSENEKQVKCNDVFMYYKEQYY